MTKAVAKDIQDGDRDLGEQWRVESGELQEGRQREFSVETEWVRRVDA